MTEPDWKIPDEELMKVSPAAVMARKFMASNEPDVAGSLEALFGTSDPSDEQINELAGGLADLTIDELRGTMPDRLRRNVETKEILKDDPMFPDRPQHPDFWELSGVLLQMDEAAEERGERDDNLLQEVLGDFDMESAIYMSKQRATHFLQLVQKLSEADQKTYADPVKLLTSTFMDGFAAGLRIGRSRPTITFIDASHRSQS